MHGGYAYTGYGSRGSAVSARVSSQHFRCIFEELRERTLRFLPRPVRSRVFSVSWNIFTIFHTVEKVIFNRFAILTLLFPLLWSLPTAFRSTVIANLIFENFGIPTLKVEIVSFQMVIILWKLTTLKGFYRNSKFVALIHGHPVVNQFKLIIWDDNSAFLLLFNMFRVFLSDTLQKKYIWWLTKLREITFLP